MFRSLALLGLLLPSIAYAEPRDDARRHFAAGLDAAREGDFQLALDEFLAAQNAYPHPSTLYNIARAYADLGDLEEAVRYYELFQVAAPDKAADVDPVLDVLRARITQQNAPPPQPAPTTDPSGTSPAAAPAATAEDLNRLKAVVEELSKLASELEERGTAAPAPQPVAPEPADPADPADPDTPPTGTPVAPDPGAFIAEAYEKQVVTASRVGQDPLDSPSTVTVVTSDDIKLSAANTIPDLLRRVVGVDVMNLASGQSDVSIRGFNRELANKVLILIDGRSTYLDFLGSTLWSTLPVTLDEIDRIEVIRGPGSAVYGANAVTGVINIITKTPGAEPRTTFRAAAGSMLYGQGEVTTNGRVGQTSYRMSAGYEQIGRWAKSAEVLESDGNPGPGALTSRYVDDENLGKRAIKGAARVDRTFGDKAYVSLQGGYAFVDTLDYFNIGALGNYVIDDLRHHTVRADFGYDVLHVRAFWNHDRGRTGPYVFQPGSRDLSGLFDTDTVDIEAEAPLRFTTGPLQHTLSLGVGYRMVDVQFDYLGGGFDESYIQNQFRGFLNEEVSIGKFKGVVSARIDKHPLLPITQTISPRASLIYRLFDKTAIRATGGSAFRQPSSIESYMDFNLPTSADGAYIRDLGNLTLRPERITTVELGLHDESTLFHSADLVLYYNRVENLIFLDDVTPSLTPYNPENKGFQAGTTGWINQDERYDGLGLEADLELYPVDGLDVFANLRLGRITVTDADGNTERDGSSALMKVNAGVAWRTPYRIDLSLSGHYTGPQTWGLREFDDNGNLVIDRTEVNRRLVIAGRVAGRPFANHDLELAAGVFNLIGLLPFDQRFQEHPKGHPTGGTLYGEVSYAF